MTKNGKPHSLPITPMMQEILERRCKGLETGDQLFKGAGQGNQLAPPAPTRDRLKNSLADFRVVSLARFIEGN